MQQKFIVKSVSAGKEDHLACRAAAGHRSLRPAISGHSAPGQLDVLRWAPLGLCGARMSKSIQSTGPGKGYNHAVMGPHSTKDRSSCKLAPWCQVLDNMHAHAGDSSPPLQAQVPDGRAGAKTPAIALKKHVSFTGITVELFEDMEEVQTPITAFSRSHTRLPSITMCPGVLYSGPEKEYYGRNNATPGRQASECALQAPSIQEPDASAFSQILECSTADLAQAGDASPQPGTRASLPPVSTAPQPAAASEQDNENEVLDWRDQPGTPSARQPALSKASPVQLPESPVSAADPGVVLCLFAALPCIKLRI